MIRHLLALLIVGSSLTAYSFLPNDSTSNIRLRIKNSSKYHIVKLTILGQTIENIRPGKKSDYLLFEPFYHSFKLDITFVKKGQLKSAPWEHVITYPIDNAGGKPIENRKNVLVLDIVESKTLGRFEIDSWVMKE